MWYRVQYYLFQVMAEQNHLFVVTAGTKPASPAAESKQVLVLIIRPFNFSKTLMKVTAPMVFLHNMRYNRTVKAIPALELLIIAFHKLDEMLIYT